MAEAIDLENINLNRVAADILTELLEVSLHNILYIREIYPAAIFERRKKYNVPVQMSLHPGLNQYIQDVVEGIKPLLEKREVEQVVIAIMNKQNHPVEKFVFEIYYPKDQTLNDDVHLTRLERALRAVCLKINVCDGVLSPLPAGCTFSVQVHTIESAVFSLENDMRIDSLPWVETEPPQVEMPNSVLIPLRTMDTKLCKVQLYVEESPNKQSS